MKPIWLEYWLSPVSRVTCCMDDQPITEGGAWKSPLFHASEPFSSVHLNPVSASFTHSGALRLGACVMWWLLFMCHKLCSSLPHEGESAGLHLPVSLVQSPREHCTSPALSCLGGRVPRHLEHHRSCQSSRTGEKMGTGHSLQSRALHQGRTMVRGCSNVPAPSVWLTSCSPGHRALWTGIWISHKGNSSMYYFWISLPIRGMRVFPAYHLSSPLSMSSFPPLNLRILWCPNSHWNKRAFLCFRRPGPLPLTSLFSRFVLRAGVRTSAVRVQWPGALSLEGGWSCHPCRAFVNMWRRHTTGGSAGWGEALSGWSIL